MGFRLKKNALLLVLLCFSFWIEVTAADHEDVHNYTCPSCPECILDIPDETITCQILVVDSPGIITMGTLLLFAWVDLIRGSMFLVLLLRLLIFYFCCRS
jgi:hypothetical protein